MRFFLTVADPYGSDSDAESASKGQSRMVNNRATYSLASFGSGLWWSYSTFTTLRDFVGDAPTLLKLVRLQGEYGSWVAFAACLCLGVMAYMGSGGGAEASSQTIHNQSGVGNVIGNNNTFTGDHYYSVPASRSEPAMPETPYNFDVWIGGMGNVLRALDRDPRLSNALDPHRKRQPASETKAEEWR